MMPNADAIALGEAYKGCPKSDENDTRATGTEK